MDELTVSTENLAAPPPAGDLVVTLGSFEGPIDLLLSLAREQKVDLAKISILALAEQYLAFIAQARRLRLELAADYLVMAAWLAYLKSRLLLPEPQEDEPGAAEMAEALKFQLQRLEAMQKAAKEIQALPQLGIDVFLRGKPEEIEVEENPVYFLPLYDLLTALAAPSRRRKPEAYALAPMRLYSLEDAVEHLRRLLGVMPSWNALLSFLPEILGEGVERRSAVASTFAATLELVKNGELELRQDGSFAPIYLRRRETPLDGDA